MNNEIIKAVVISIATTIATHYIVKALDSASKSQKKASTNKKISL